MKVAELIRYLEDQDSDAEVLIAHQPSWPLQETIQGVGTVYEAGCEDEEDEDEGAKPNEFVYIVAGGHPWDESPYAPRSVFNL